MTYVRRAYMAMDTRIDMAAWREGAREEDLVRALDDAAGVFYEVEAVATRFRLDSDVARIAATPGVWVPVSPHVWYPLQVALWLAEWTGGRFDPACGHRLAALGFDRDYQTGERLAWPECSPDATFRDVDLDPARQAVRTRRPLLLDLGAVAKGYAVDLALARLRGALLDGALVNAGGDLAAFGSAPGGGPWEVEVRHEIPGFVPMVFSLASGSVCSSGLYARRSPRGASHLWYPRPGRAQALAATVVAPYAMMADGLATACMLVEPDELEPLCEEAGAQAKVWYEDGTSVETRGWRIHVLE
ncbi:FAD:protein FMN transferase [Alicyclobacillus acidocaldarius]|uniref:FAD:protein FMN transferase n=1 Tax=Alicyclobacillus acidocaldarius (strain Tc-4-1) TaxID=1048834 RepID=F8IK81_ALIAT|nr:FAD:protein FMN transferase [Alicyclobacillus acidocaldarius]AEJ44787.1 ApbE family lipoprotein [Alicyclobacillus acidocaldarius subsp. acidocaldarius Tc-4-1]